MLYTVQPGDTLFLIARRFNTTAEGIAALNNLTSTALTAGQRLIIPLYTEVVVTVDRALIRSGPGQNHPSVGVMVRGARLPVVASAPGWYRVRIHNRTLAWISATVVNLRAYGPGKPITEILGFYTLPESATLPGSFSSFANNTDLLSEVALFMFRIDRNNPTQIEKFGTFTDNDVDILVAIAHRNNVMILPVVHNLLYKDGGTTTSKDVVKQMVSSYQNRRAFIQNLINLVERYGFDGVNIDIEDVYQEDSARLSAFYTELGMAFRQRGYFLSASVPSRIRDYPPFNPFSDPFNYSAIGAAVDQFSVMLYNEHGWPGSGPGPVVSIGWMETVLRYTITKMPASKVIAAVSVFGFDFNLTTGGVSYVSHAAALDLARKYNQQVTFDAKSQTPMFAYTDEQGDKHEVWFEDSRSIFAKIQLANQLGIAGVALWRLGIEDPAIWTMLNTDVVVRKI